MRKHRTKFKIGLDYSDDQLERAKNILIGTKNTQKQIEGDPSLMEYIGDENTEFGRFRVYQIGRTLYKYTTLPESNPDAPIHLMELCGIVRAES